MLTAILQPSPRRSAEGRFHVRRAFALVVAAATLLIAGCQPQPAATAPPTARSTPSAAPGVSPTARQATAFPLQLVDDEGATVVIPAPPERIVSLTPAATETLFAIGAGDRVAGKVEDVANHPPEAASVPIVGTFAGVDVEQIIGLGADLVIAGGGGGTPQDAIDQLRRLGLPVLVVYAPDIETVFADIELIGRAAGEDDAARDLVAAMRAEFDQVRAATRDLDRPRVFYETGDQPALYGVADDSFVAAMIELAGGDPITTGSSTIWEMSSERLVAADPEVIVLGDAAYGVTPDAVAARPGWDDLTAVRQDRIHPIDDIVVTRPGPRLGHGLRALVEAIHPDVALPEPSPVPLASRAP